MKIASYTVRLLASLVVVATVSSCGGGSGGGSGSAGAPPPNPAGNSVTLTPSRADLSMYEGEAVDFTFTATSSQTKTAINMAVGEKGEVMFPVYDVTAVSAGVYRADMHTWTSLSAGVHETNLEVRLCEDSPAICKLPVAGSPLVFPVKVTVKSKAEGAARVTVSPAMDLTMVRGTSLNFTVNAKAAAPFDRQVFAGVFDRSGNVLSASPMTSSFGQEYNATMLAPSTLRVGIYTINLEVRLCIDSALTCRFPMAGSPWIVQVKLTVKA